MTPFGWRVTNVLFGILLIVIIYYFALRLFRDRFFALSGAFMITFSFMHFTQSRIGLIDTFGVTLLLVSYYLFYRFIIKQRVSYLLLSGIFFGLASAVKWSALFGSLGFLAIAIYLILSKYPFKREFAGYRLILYGLSSHIILASVVYVATFFDLYMQSDGFQKIIDYQINMYNYHSMLQATHAYSSAWWSWILDIKPMCYYREMSGEAFSSITVFGNPALFWMGTISILYLIFVAIRRVSIEAIFILFAFLGVYLPYIFIGRVMFIYHFYYAVPFMFLAILYMWRDLINYSSRFYRFFLIFLAIVAGLFLLFYPVLSGYEVTKSYVNSYLVWFSGWWL
jgi:dolichyl-phosphate-mannose--protein O-mannosyl transferase